jgi:hypothetical protein
VKNKTSITLAILFIFVGLLSACSLQSNGDTEQNQQSQQEKPGLVQLKRISIQGSEVEEVNATLKDLHSQGMEVKEVKVEHPNTMWTAYIIVYEEK